MEIISHGNKYGISQVFVCNKCLCTFKANYNEYRRVQTTVGERVYWDCKCKCPECGAEVITDER